MGSYAIDSHNVQRYITPEGYVQNEGDIGVSTKGPYEIAYGSLVPKKGQGDNLLVPVCLSSSHIAFGSIRMEPVFMILGQSAATAAAMAIDSGMAVQDVPYEKLRAAAARRRPGAGVYAGSGPEIRARTHPLLVPASASDDSYRIVGIGSPRAQSCSRELSGISGDIAAQCVSIGVNTGR